MGERGGNEGWWGYCWGRGRRRRGWYFTLLHTVTSPTIQFSSVVLFHFAIILTTYPSNLQAPAPTNPLTPLREAQDRYAKWCLTIDIDNRRATSLQVAQQSAANEMTVAQQTMEWNEKRRAGNKRKEGEISGEKVAPPRDGGNGVPNGDSEFAVPEPRKRKRDDTTPAEKRVKTTHDDQSQSPPKQPPTAATATTVPPQRPRIPQNTIYTTSFPASYTENDITLIFEKYGDIVEIRIPPVKKGNTISFAYVEFSNRVCSPFNPFPIYFTHLRS